MAKSFFFMGPGAGDTNRAALTTWTGQPKVWGDVAAPQDWLKSHPDAQNRYRQGNPYLVNIPGAPPGPFSGGKYRVSDAGYFGPSRPHTTGWEFNLPKGMNEQSFYDRSKQSPVKILAPNELPQPLEPAPAAFTPAPLELGSPNPNPVPNETMLPTPVDTYRPVYNNPAPNETMSPTPVDTYRPVYDNPAPNETMLPTEVGDFNPAPNEFQYPSQINYQPPVNIPINDFNVNPTPNDFYRGAEPYNPPVYDQNVATPVDQYQPADIYNPVPPESTGYPTPVDVYNPAPSEEVGIPTPIGELNPPPNEEMTATPVDTYYPAGDGSYVPLDANGNPIKDQTPPPKTPSAPPASVPLAPAGSVPPPIPPEEGQGHGGWGEPAGFFGVANQNPIGMFGVGGPTMPAGGGSYFGGPGTLAIPGTTVTPSYGGGGGSVANMAALYLHSGRMQKWAQDQGYKSIGDWERSTGFTLSGGWPGAAKGESSGQGPSGAGRPPTTSK